MEVTATGEAAQLKVGFVGLGNQGEPIARRILEAGWPLEIWARRPESMAALASSGASIAPTLIELGARCDIVGVCVTTDDDVRHVLVGDGDGVLHGLRAGSIVAVHSTVAPPTVMELSRLAEERNTHLLDAPVSGGPAGARMGTMTIMVGGDESPLIRASPVFESYASTIAHLGPVGSGQLMKLLNNNLCFANVVASIGALQLAEALGMDPRVAGQVMGTSSGSSSGLRIVTDEALLRKASGPTSNMAKDVRLLEDVIRAKGLPMSSLVALSAAAPLEVREYARHVLDA